ncbi:protein fosB [Crotalus adamanteus]|uniref:Protein fosB n=1 Tax=Crotalus adamanteus TaxID=8729 RepID=A0AAW1AWN1_CROAD
MYQGFPGDYDSTSRCSSSPSAESHYLSSVDSFGSPTVPAAASSQVRKGRPAAGLGGSAEGGSSADGPIGGGGFATLVCPSLPAPRPSHGQTWAVRSLPPPAWPVGGGSSCARSVFPGASGRRAFRGVAKGVAALSPQVLPAVRIQLRPIPPCTRAGGEARTRARKGGRGCARVILEGWPAPVAKGRSRAEGRADWPTGVRAAPPPTRPSAGCVRRDCPGRSPRGARAAGGGLLRGCLDGRLPWHPCPAALEERRFGSPPRRAPDLLPAGDDGSRGAALAESAAPPGLRSRPARLGRPRGVLGSGERSPPGCPPPGPGAKARASPRADLGWPASQDEAPAKQRSGSRPGLRAGFRLREPALSSGRCPLAGDPPKFGPLHAGHRSSANGDHFGRGMPVEPSFKQTP